MLLPHLYGSRTPLFIFTLAAQTVSLHIFAIDRHGFNNMKTVTEKKKKKREYNIEIIKIHRPKARIHPYSLQEVTRGNIMSPTSLWETHFACRSAPRCLCMVGRCICSGCLQSSEMDGITLIICFTLAPHTHTHVSTNTSEASFHDKVVSLYFAIIGDNIHLSLIFADRLHNDRVAPNKGKTHQPGHCCETSIILYSHLG